MHSDKMPKTLLREIKRNSHLIAGYHFEPDGFGGPGQGEWSIWIDLMPGYRCTLSDTGTIHEATAKEAIMAIRGVKAE